MSVDRDKKLMALDCALEIPAQEVVEMTKQGLHCERDTALKILGVGGSVLASGLAGWDDPFNVLAPAILAVNKYILVYKKRVDASLEIRDEAALNPQIFIRLHNSAFNVVLGVVGTILLHEDFYIFFLDLVAYSYMCNRYHDTGSFLREKIKSKAKKVLSKFHKPPVEGI